jgi:hypothetical protein
MDDFPQSAASPARRRVASSRRLLGLFVVLALVLALPGRALAARTSTFALTSAGTALTYDTTSDELPPSDPTDPTTDSGEPAPPSSDPAPSDPAPSDPAPTPSDPEPTPSEPAPAPSEPAPSDPAPAPGEPAPAPSDPAPAPSDPVPPADEVPVDPAPASSEPAPSDPAPRDGRVARPPASEEREVSTAPPSAPPVAPLAPSTVAPSTADPATDAAKATDGKRQAKVVRAAYRRLGLGTIAAPAAPGAGTSVTVAPAQACTPIGAVAVTEGPQGATGLASRADIHPRRVEDDAPTVRGPPAPLQSPSSPIATAGAASAGAGGASSDRDCAILADQIVFTLAGGGCATASDCCDHAAPAPANAAARAPPVA